MRRQGLAAASILVIFAALTGCVKHNDTLLFGTKTNVGVEIGATPEGGAIPELIVGYKRREAVLMPLLVNGNDSKGAACASTDSCKYQGKTENRDGKTGFNETDTYSVFASFGAEVSAGQSNSVGLAQFFATGIAAQRLGENAQIGNALAVQPANTEALNQAKARADLAEKQIVTAEQMGAARESAKTTIAVRKVKVDFILTKMIDASGKLSAAKRDKAIEGAGLDDMQKGRLESFSTVDDLKDALMDDEKEAVDPLYDSLVKAI